MKISELFPSRYLSPIDLKGKTARVTIEKVELESLRDPRSNQNNDKLVVHFIGKEKALVLNKTNAYTIAEILGDDTDDWIGGQISLYTAQIKVGGEPKDCIRVSTADQNPKSP